MSVVILVQPFQQRFSNISGRFQQQDWETRGKHPPGRV